VRNVGGGWVGHMVVHFGGKLRQTPVTTRKDLGIGGIWPPEIRPERPPKPTQKNIFIAAIIQKNLMFMCARLVENGRYLVSMLLV